MTVTSILERQRHDVVDAWPAPRNLPTALPAVYLRGDRITPADLATHFGYVDAGLLAAVRTDPRGQEAIVEVRGAGATLGEDSLIGYRSLDAGTYFEALVPTRVSWIEPGSIQTDGHALSKAVLSILATRVRQQQETAHRTRLQSLAQRVADQLVALSHETVLGSDETALHHLSRFDLARTLGTNRSAVSKLCTGFERRGWCHIDGKSITVTDEAALTSYAARGVTPSEDSIHERMLQHQQVLIDLAARRRSA
jgi:CRP-like cAMP-binding protein